MTEGGILTVYKEIINSFIRTEGVELICLVHDKNLFSELPTKDNIEYIEYKSIKESWFKRLYFEYVYSYFLSKRLNADTWVCLHDMSSFIYNAEQYVYCHNPTPFYHATLNDFRLDKKFYIFTKLYKYLYKINIKRNKKVIVQQHWIADKFSEWYDLDNILISRPENKNEVDFRCDNLVSNKNGVYSFIYPAVPRVFKNFDVIINSLSYIKEKRIDIYKKINIIFTFKKDMNLVANDIFDKVANKGLDCISFIGFLSRDEMRNQYETVSGIIFPSKLETWGLPLSELKEYHLPVIAADLPYAHETLGNYPKKKFFDVDDFIALAQEIIDLIENGSIELDYKEEAFSKLGVYSEVKSWNELKDVIIGGCS